jgi:hypothetical protein
MHRRQHPMASTQDFTLRLSGQQRQQRSVVGVGEVDRASCFG